MKKVYVVLFSIILILSTTSCKGHNNIQRICKGKKIELYFLNREQNYGRFGMYWADFSLDDFMLMDLPFLTSEDIESYKNNTIKIKKNFVTVEGTGLRDSYIYDNFTEGTLSFSYDNKNYEVKKPSSELFYYEPFYDICVVNYDDTIFLVTQEGVGKNNDNKEEAAKEKYKKSVIGLPYILVVNGVRKELGILKVSEGEFLVRDVRSSMSYAGMPEDLPVVVPDGNLLEFYVKN